MKEFLRNVMGLMLAGFMAYSVIVTVVFAYYMAVLVFSA